MKSLVKAVCASAALLLSGGFALPAQTPLIGVYPDSGRKFDEYPYLPFKEEEKRLANLVAQLRSEASAGSKAYVYVFGGSGRPANEARARACRAKHYLIAARIDSKRVIAAAITNGSDKSRVELWVWPREAPDDLMPDGSAVVYISDEEAKACNGRVPRKRRAASNKALQLTAR